MRTYKINFENNLNNCMQRMILSTLNLITDIKIELQKLH